MFDIGFWELLVIAVVLLLVMGPERLPEVAKQAAFLLRKARQGMFRLRSEMQSEIDATPFRDLQEAKREMTNFKNDIKQFGRDLADSAEQQIDGSSKAESKDDRSSTGSDGTQGEDTAVDSDSGKTSDAEPVASASAADKT